MIARVEDMKVLKETDKSYLLQMPDRKTTFWHPRKFCAFEGTLLIELWFAPNFTACVNGKVGKVLLADILKEHITFDDRDFDNS